MRGQKIVVPGESKSHSARHQAGVRDIVVITVQYRNLSDTETLIRSLSAMGDCPDCRVIVVDNDITGNDTEKLAALAEAAPFPVVPVHTGENLYYWGGAAFAIDRLSGLGVVPPRWVIVCNNDVTFDETFLTRLRALDPAQFPIIAPTIVSEATGRDQNPYLETPPGAAKRLKWRIYDMEYAIATTLLAVHRSLKGLAGILRRPTEPSRTPAVERTIYAPHGACVILSEAFFNAGGTLDTRIPMFAEELTLAVSAIKLGLPVWYLPALRIAHREHSTTGIELTRPKYELERRARRHYYALAD